MFQAILVKTEYDPRLMLDDREWLKDFLLGSEFLTLPPSGGVPHRGQIFKYDARKREKILLEVSRR